jgi:predicted heme/steroid binding protein
MAKAAQEMVKSSVLLRESQGVNKKMEDREFTAQELMRFDGEQKKRVNISYEGIVYDVSSSYLWKSGRHQAVHFAGLDLSGQLEETPHGVKLLKRFQIVGRLKEE